ncbi:MAG: calcium-binding protein [Pikeienuella sp.]
MTIEIVDPESTDLIHLASVDVKFSGAHLGGGIYFSANHNPQPGGTGTAITQRGLTNEGTAHSTVEIDYTLPADEDPWDAYRDGTNNVLPGFDMALHVGERLENGSFYDGPTAPLLIASDPTDLIGAVTITGYPNSNRGSLAQSEGQLSSGGYFENDVAGDIGGFFLVTGAEATAGMSGGATWLEFDPDGDGQSSQFLIGSVSRAGTVEVDGTPTPAILSTAFSTHYTELADAIQSLTDDDARSADDFGRMTLLSGQSLGSEATSVNGQFFHEDIYGGVNDDNLSGGAGDDMIFGGLGADTIDGGDGFDFVSYAGDDAAIKLDLLGKARAKGEAANDLITNIEGIIGTSFNDRLKGDQGANSLLGGAGDDKLVGRKGDDTLDGGDGNDLLLSGKGADVLTGGEGADTFVFRGVRWSRPEETDHITDFDGADGDIIDLTKIDAARGIKGNQAFDFIGTDEFSGERGTLRFETIGENTLIQGDRNGNSEADFELLLIGVHDLSEGSFLL